MIYSQNHTTGMTSMHSNAMSVFYHSDSFNHMGTKIFGRMSANGHLLKGLIDFGKRDSLSIYVKDESQYSQFKSTFTSTNQIPKKQFNKILYGDVASLYQSTLHFTPDPLISKTAWARSFMHPSAFSICGLTHTIATLHIAEEIGKFIFAPIHSWDALICTSRAVKSAVTEIFNQWYCYLRNEKKFNYQSPIQLPVIPLGINTNELAPIENKLKLRKHFREKYQINDHDFVVLFFGRLSFYDKAHPIPMYLALEALSNRIGKSDRKIHFVQAGWFEFPKDLNNCIESAKTYCPSINHILIDEIQAKQRPEIFSGADVFISLVDNIQESFGLVPLEAMANELPVIVSDWDGYKDTVREGIDGFRIPSYLAPAGCGVDFGIGYLADALNYNTYCGSLAQVTAIDIAKTVEALYQLYQSKELRMEMGKNARERVLTTYDWKHIIKQYDELWDDLTKRRLAANQTHPPKYISPILADPFMTFSSYPTHILQPNDKLSLTQHGKEKYSKLQNNEMALAGRQSRLPHPHILTLLDHITQKEIETADELIKFCAKLDKTIINGIVARTIIYLIKYDVLRIIT